MVVGGKEDIFAEGLQTVVQRVDGFEIEVIGRLVEDQGIGITQHHPSELAANSRITRKGYVAKNNFWYFGRRILAPMTYAAIPKFLSIKQTSPLMPVTEKSTVVDCYCS